LPKFLIVHQKIFCQICLFDGVELLYEYKLI
jgi:hypothetical protein